MDAPGTPAEDVKCGGQLLLVTRLGATRRRCCGCYCCVHQLERILPCSNKQRSLPPLPQHCLITRLDAQQRLLRLGAPAEHSHRRN